MTVFFSQVPVFCSCGVAGLLCRLYTRGAYAGLGQPVALRRDPEAESFANASGYQNVRMHGKALTPALRACTAYCEKWLPFC